MEILPIFDKFVIAQIVTKRIEISSELKAVIRRDRIQILKALVGDTSDFLPFNFLEKGASVGKPVGRLVVRMDKGRGPEVCGYGTGFLVTPSILMTNAHVLPTPESGKNSLVQFNYEIDKFGNEKVPSEFCLDPYTFFITNPKEKLDFTLIGVAKKDGVIAGKSWGNICLMGSPAKVMVGEPVNIIQHPNSRRKEVVVQKNEVTGFFEGGYIHYKADTLGGSSGSPVFNNQWVLMALHHSGVYKRNEQGNIVIHDGAPVFEANEGIRISAIVDYLKSDAVSDDHRKILDGYI